jgi:hypothetical protein
MADETILPVPADDRASATHRPPHPLQSRLAENEIGKFDFAPGGQAKQQEKHRATQSFACTTRSPRSLGR